MGKLYGMWTRSQESCYDCVYVFFFLFSLSAEDSQKGIGIDSHQSVIYFRKVQRSTFPKYFRKYTTKVIISGGSELNLWNVTLEFIRTPIKLIDSANGSFALQWEDWFCLKSHSPTQFPVKVSCINIRVGRSPKERNSNPTPVFWPGEFHRQRIPWTELFL